MTFLHYSRTVFRTISLPLFSAKDRCYVTFCKYFSVVHFGREIGGACRGGHIEQNMKIEV